VSTFGTHERWTHEFLCHEAEPHVFSGLLTLRILSFGEDFHAAALSREAIWASRAARIAVMI
jgi:hypothetical protein